MIFIANYSEYNKIDKFWSPQDYKDTNEFIAKVFNNLIDLLNYCPEITSVIIISHPIYSLTKEDFIRFFNSVESKSKLLKMATSSKILPSLPETMLKNAKIFDYKDLGIYDVDMPEYHDIHVIGIYKLQDIIKEEAVVTNSIFLSKIFVKIIKNFPRLYIYKRAFEKSDKYKLLKVDDTKGYLDFIYKFDEDNDDRTKNIEHYILFNLIGTNIIDCFAYNETLPRSISAFYTETLKIYDGSIKKINFVGSEKSISDYLIDNIITELENKFKGKFSLEGKIVKKKNIGVVVFNINEKLEQENIKEIISEIRSNKYPDKFYVLHSTVTLQNTGDPSVKVIMVPPYDHIKSMLVRILFYVTKKTFDLPDFRIIKNIIYYRPIIAAFSTIPSFDKLLNVLEDLKYGKNFHDIDFAHRDFWWEFDQYLRLKDWSIIAPESPSRSKPPIIFKFEHIKDDNKWTIRITKHDPKNVSKAPTIKTHTLDYKKYKGLYYMLVLSRYYPEGEEIEINQLYKIVDKMVKGKTNRGNNSPKTSIPEAIKTFCYNPKNKNYLCLFKKDNGQLQKYFHVDKEQCYFDPKGQIEIIVTDIEFDKQYNKIIADLNNPSNNPSK